MAGIGKQAALRESFKRLVAIRVIYMMWARYCIGVVGCRASKGRGGVRGRAGVTGSGSSGGGMAGLDCESVGIYGEYLWKRGLHCLFEHSKSVRRPEPQQDPSLNGVARDGSE